MRNEDLLTAVEAVAFYKTGELPEDFRDRIEAFVALYECQNCGGVRDMAAVMRAWDDPNIGQNTCPDCCVDGECVVPESIEWTYSGRIAVPSLGWWGK